MIDSQRTPLLQQNRFETCFVPGPMELDRRRFLQGAIAASALASLSCRDGDEGRIGSVTAASPQWREVREQFELNPDVIHMSALLISSHPRVVREAIETYRREIDRDPVRYLQDNNGRLQERSAEAAEKYIGAASGEVALTDSTTMGIGLVYNGLSLAPGDEILTTEHDYYATHEALRLAAQRTGARVREIRLYDSLQSATPESITAALERGLTPRTRVVALTWVHSGTGLKIPVRQITDRLRSIRPDLLIALDGVHAFGIEHVDVPQLGVDFFMAGAHKWLFGPRGTGILWAGERGREAIRPTIPSFMSDRTWQAWINGNPPGGPVTGARLTPGGFKAFEHQWSMPEAFEFHEDIGRDRVQQRTHELAQQLKEGLAGMSHVNLITPRGSELSSGIVCFEVAGLGPEGVVEHLASDGVIATITPYATPYARLTPSIRNSAAEVEAALESISAMG